VWGFGWWVVGLVVWVVQQWAKMREVVEIAGEVWGK
jgi:hypothetical protein